MEFSATKPSFVLDTGLSSTFQDHQKINVPTIVLIIAYITVPKKSENPLSGGHKRCNLLGLKGMKKRSFLRKKSVICCNAHTPFKEGLLYQVCLKLQGNNV